MSIINEDTWEQITNIVDHGSLKEVKLIYSKEGRDYWSVNQDGENLLQVAARKGKLEIVKFLMEVLMEPLKNDGEIIDNEDIHVNYKDKMNWTALMEAAWQGHDEVVNCLLDEHALINQADNDGWTALMLAADRGHLGIVDALVEKDPAVLSLMDKQGFTAMKQAAQRQRLPVVKHLLKRGAFKVSNDILEKLFVIDFLRNPVNKISLDMFDTLSDIIEASINSGEIRHYIDECQEGMNAILANIIEASPDLVQDPAKMFIFYRGTLYMNLIGLLLLQDNQNVSFQVKILRVLHTAIQAKCSCETREESQNGENNQQKGNERGLLEEMLEGDARLFNSLTEKIRTIREEANYYDYENEKESAKFEYNEDHNDCRLIAEKIFSEFIKPKNGCVEKTMTKLVSCCEPCVQVTKSWWEKVSCRKTKRQTSRLSHNCRERSSFALISCTLAVIFYMLDLITDFTVGYEDYNGFSKKLGTFEMFLVVFTLMHENIRSSESLYSTESELLQIKLGRQNLELSDWEQSELHKSDQPVKQFLYKIFWPFAVRKEKSRAQRVRAVLYNLLTLLQLRPVVDRLRVLLHSKANLRIFYCHRTEQDSLKQFYLITEQLPELLIQFYTLQILFNINASGKDTFVNCEITTGKNFSYPRFTDSLNNPDERNWFCDTLPINSVSGLMTCDMFFRIFSAMIPFFSIPSGILSLEEGFRVLDPVTPKMSKVVKNILQLAYTLMIPARLLMFAALMHSVTKEFVFGYIIFRAFPELLSNLLSLEGLRNTKTVSSSATDKNSKSQNDPKKKRTCLEIVRDCVKYIFKFGTIWKISMFSLRDLFAVSIREPDAYMENPSNVTHQGIRDRRSLSKRIVVFLLEGLVGAWIVEEFYPCGRHSEIFRYIGWVCLACLLASGSLFTVISDLLHPKHLLLSKKNVLKLCNTKYLGGYVVLSLFANVIFCLTRPRTTNENLWAFLGINCHIVISGIAVLVIKLVDFTSFKKSSKDEAEDDEDNRPDKDENSSCCLTMCCYSYNCYKKIPQEEREKSTEIQLEVLPNDLQTEEQVKSGDSEKHSPSGSTQHDDHGSSSSAIKDLDFQC